MKSKIPPISKSSQLKTDSLADDLPGIFPGALAIGHRPSILLAPQDEALFRAFQSNLLSLISHELRTPLTGILNGLGVLESSFQADSGPLAELFCREMIQMARKNAEQLQKVLHSLLNLAAIEGGHFHVRLREVDFRRVAWARFEACQKLFLNRNLKVEWIEGTQVSKVPPLLADPQKLGHAIDLCFQILALHGEPSPAEKTDPIRVQLFAEGLELSRALSLEAENALRASWSQSLVGLQGGLASPYSAFAGVLQSEEAFLTRAEEGLGSEFLLIHEILRLHRGQFTAGFEAGIATLRLELPEMSSLEGLKAVLASRAYPLSSELGSFVLILMSLPKDSCLATFRNEISQSLFRTTDAAYSLPDQHQIALVLNDCKNEDTFRVMKRVLDRLKVRLKFGSAHCPTDGLDSGLLLEIAQKRLHIELHTGVAEVE